MTQQDFPVKLTLRIDWSEMDTFGHVNNVSFFKYIQASRVHYWEQVGLDKLHKEAQIGPILASCKCDFKKPLFYPGSVNLYSRREFIKNTSFSICHCLVDETGDIVAEAQDIIVLYNFNTHQKVPFPTDLKSIIEKLEQKTF
jgi:acyl-CoA thioester hydrolase